MKLEGVLQDLQPCGVMRTGTAWLTAAAATPVSYKLCTASYARSINIYDLQVRLHAALLNDSAVICNADPESDHVVLHSCMHNHLHQ